MLLLLFVVWCFGRVCFHNLEGDFLLITMLTRPFFCGYTKRLLRTVNNDKVLPSKIGCKSWPLHLPLEASKWLRSHSFL